MDSQTKIESLTTNPFVVVVIILLVGVVLLLSLRDRRYVMFGYLFLVPLATMPAFAGRLFGVPGLSVQNLVMALGLYAVFLTRSSMNRMDRNLRIALIFYWLMVVIVVLHGVFHLNELPTGSRPVDENALYDYLRSYLFVPVLAWLSFVAAYRYAASGGARAIEFIRYVGISTIWFSTLTIGSVIYYFMKFKDYNIVRDMVASLIGIHSNDYSIALAMAAPLLIAGVISKRFLPPKDRILFWLGLAAVVVAVLFSYSRTGYLSLGLAVFTFVIFTKRSLLWWLVPLMAALVLFAPATVVERVHFGFKSDSAESGKSYDLNYISAGRLGMAKEAFKIITSDIGQMAFGGGRLTFPRYTYKKFGVGHPHNAYLELLLDAGVIGFLAIMYLFLLLFARAAKGVRQLHGSEYRIFYMAAAVSLGIYFLTGLSRGSFFPHLQLIFVWQVSGFALGLLRYDLLRSREQTQAAAKTSSRILSSNVLRHRNATSGKW